MKKVYQYDLDGNFIREWESATSAEKELHITHVASAAKMTRRIAGKYQWRNYYSERINKIDLINKSQYKVYQYDLDGNFIKEWDNLSTINKELGFTSKRLVEVIRGEKRSSNGFIWSKVKQDKVDPVDSWRKPIYQYDIYGNFIREWRNSTELLKEYTNISYADLMHTLHNRQKTCRNYQWSFEKKENIGEVSIYKRKSLVYVYTNTITNEKYVGQTRASVKQRAGKNGKAYSHCTKFWDAIQKYGWDNFTVEIVQKNLEQQDADKLEQLLIEKYDSINNGYNTHLGGILTRK